MRHCTVPSSSSPLLSLLDWTPLTLVTLLGVLLRVYRIDTSLWLDELHTGWVVIDGPAYFMERATEGNYSPAYFFFPWLATLVFGPTEFALRLPSVLAGVTIIPLVYRLVRRWFGSKMAALMSACLVSIDPFCVSFSQEARVYALLQLVALIHIGIVCRLVRHPTRTLRWTWILLGGFLFHLHYTSGLLLLAEFIFIAIAYNWSGRTTRYVPHQSLLDTAFSIALCLPAFGHLSEIFARRANWNLFVPIPTLYDLLTTFPLEIYLVLPLIFVGLNFLWRRQQGVCSPSVDVAPPFLVLLGCWLVLPLIMAWLLTVLDIARLFWPRYLMIVYVALIVGTGYFCASVVGIRSRIITAMVVVLTALVTYGPVGQIRSTGELIGDRGENWREAIDWINNHTNDETSTLFVQPGLIESNALRNHSNSSLVAYCLFPVSSIYRVTETVSERFPLPTTAAATHVKFSENPHRSILLLLRGPEDQTARLLNQVVHKLRLETDVIVSKQHYSGLAVAKFEATTFE